jgi:hypothetical protein
LWSEVHLPFGTIKVAVFLFVIDNSELMKRFWKAGEFWGLFNFTRFFKSYVFYALGNIIAILNGENSPSFYVEYINVMKCNENCWEGFQEH